jgi:mono/diheme cytochrome c family protein
MESVKLTPAITLALPLLLAGCRSVPPPTPLDQLNPAQAHGYQVFQAHCATCHHDRDDDPLHGPGLAGLYKKQYMPSGAPANDDRIMSTIVHGRNNMPAMGGQLDDLESSDLLAYLHTI